MIVRILGDRQYRLDDTELDALNVLDERLQRAVESRDGAAFGHALRGLLAAVRERGTPVPDSTLTTSDLVLPAADATADDVIALLGADGLIPG